MDFAHFKSVSLDQDRHVGFEKHLWSKISIIFKHIYCPVDWLLVSVEGWKSSKRNPSAAPVCIQTEIREGTNYFTSAAVRPRHRLSAWDWSYKWGWTFYECITLTHYTTNSSGRSVTLAAGPFWRRRGDKKCNCKSRGRKCVLFRMCRRPFTSLDMCELPTCLCAVPRPGFLHLYWKQKLAGA